MNAKHRGFIGKPNGQKCVDCGKRAEQWEHRNYARPLMVEPTCISCNLKRGNSNNKAPKSCPRCKARLDSKKQKVAPALREEQKQEQNNEHNNT